MDMENEIEESNKPDALYVVPLFLACILGIVSNALIIYHTVRKSVKSVIKTYFLIWSVVTTVYLTVMPGVIALSLYHDVLVTHHWYMVVILEVSSMLEAITLFLVLVMCIFWFLAIRNRNFKGYFRSVFFSIFAISLIFCAVSLVQCHNGNCLNANYLNMSIYGILFLLVIFMHIIKFLLSLRGYRRVSSSNFILLIVTSYVLCWFPTWFCIILLIFKIHLDWPKEYFMALCAGSLNSFVNLILFVFLNRHFRLRLMASFGCLPRRYAQPEDSFSDSDDNLEESEVTAI